MKIACLGWSSLIWDPRLLPIQREWFKDGPFVPVEFTRHSSGDRITLVIEPGADSVRVLWAHMIPKELQAAREALRDREELLGDNWSSRIGSWQRGEPNPASMPELDKWAEAHGLEAVIWTALGHKFQGKEVAPTVEQVIEHLRSLTGTKQENARRYIERAPRQIDTEYRRRIETALGWSYQETDS